MYPLREVLLLDPTAIPTKQGADSRFEADSELCNGRTDNFLLWSDRLSERRRLTASATQDD
jgi:hypothetical protein